MKKMSLLFILILPFLFTIAQTVEREEVILEIATGTWCQWCPGAAAAADQLVDEGKDVAVIEHHNGDPYANQYSNARNSYYSIGGYPTGHMDGIEEYEGGAMCPNIPGSTYPAYLQLYNERKPIQSAFTIDMQGYHNGNNYFVTLTINKVATSNTDNCKVHLVLTESNISVTWFCLTDCDFVNRLMVPNENGTTLNLDNNQQVINLSFTLQSSWDPDECELVSFIQYNTTKEIYQGIKLALNDLVPPPVTADFSATPTMVCAGGTVNYTDNSLGNITQWQWTFPGGTPATSNLENPTIIYNTAGTYDATLSITDGYSDDEITKTNFITVGNAVPTTPSQPEGTDQLCKNPTNTTYSTTPVPQAAYYNWKIVPSTAGLATGTGSTITINWVNAFTGTAGIIVQAINGCGESDYSDTLFVTISAPPVVYNLTGGGPFCEGSEGSEIGLDNSEMGVNYELYLENNPTGIIASGTGSPISFGLINQLGIYTAVGNNPTTTCTSNMSNTAEVSVVTLPLTFTITGGGEYCDGTGGAAVGLNGSQYDCEYELYLDGVATGITIPGTGSAISFGNQTEIGTYTAVGIKTEFECFNNMEGSSAVNIIYMPEVPAMPGGPTYVDLYYIQISQYATTGSANSNAYAWSLEPSNAGELETISLLESQVTWNSGFLGLATIKVSGTNQCGESAWSETLEVTIGNSVGIGEQGNDLGIKISPNPNTGQFKLEINTAKNDAISFKITNTLNSIVFEKNDIQINGHYTTTIDLGNATHGIYLLTVQSHEKIVVKKIVIQ
ncbi:MAG: PKD domain-containing protein [Bacteroidetes bacterium]|nr:PKD domain-containing protein [Bacteroidota bacterium]